MSTINADVDGIILTADSSATLSLATGDVVRATIDSSGNVGIGTSSPGQKLTVAGTVESTSVDLNFLTVRHKLVPLLALRQ